MELVGVAAVGVIGSLVTQLIKKLSAKVGGHWAQLVVLGIVFLIALGWSLFKAYAPVDVVKMVITSYAMAIAFYETFVYKIVK